jgi:hypothetical protein
MGDALSFLPPEPQTLESDRLRLESDYFVTRQALGFEEGVWFLLPVRDEGPSWAYLSQCGSLIQSFNSSGPPGEYFNSGKIWHCFRDPRSEGKLPESFGPDAMANGMFALV